jgi:hypothetical protein
MSLLTFSGRNSANCIFFALVSIFSSFPMCSCQRTAPSCHRLKVSSPEKPLARQINCFSVVWLYSAHSNIPHSDMVGVTGFEPVTLRLSSACSNQLSYTPDFLEVSGCWFPSLRVQQPATRNFKLETRKAVGGAEEIRTPDL